MWYCKLFEESGFHVEKRHPSLVLQKSFVTVVWKSLVGCIFCNIFVEFSENIWFVSGCFDSRSSPYSKTGSNSIKSRSN